MEDWDDDYYYDNDEYDDDDIYASDFGDLESGEVSFDFGMNEDVVFDPTAFVGIFAPDPDAEPVATDAPKLRHLRYDMFNRQYQRFVFDPNKKPSRVSQQILDDLEDLSDLFDDTI